MPPNILLILTDQHRLSAVGSYGKTPCLTPHLDQLASEGIRFENVYTACPVCTPARASIMTGEAPHRHGLRENTEDVGSPVNQLPDHSDLLSRRLQRQGYRLGYTGKWHLGSDDRQRLEAPIQPSLPRDVGFEGDNFPGHGDGGWIYEQFDHYLRHRGLKCEYEQWPEEGEPFREPQSFRRMTTPVEATVPYYLTDNTIELVDRFSANGADEPFFIWHNYWGPHEPYCPTVEYLDMYRDVEIPPWENFDWPAFEIPGPHRLALPPAIRQAGRNLPWENWARGIRYYYAFTTMIDAQIGRLMDHLRKRSLLDNTIIIFAADHGEALGDHGGTYNKGWTHFEETHRIPLIVRMPDGTGAGTVEQRLASLLDLYPTILDFAGDAPCGERPPLVGGVHGYPYQVPHHPDGESLRPLIEGQDVAWRDLVVSEFHGLLDNTAMMRTMRCGRWKYGFTFMGTDELYDLENDPHEMHNLIDDPDYAETADRLLRRLHGWMVEHEDGYAYGVESTRLL